MTGACRACGCTEHQACMTEAGPCGWAEEGLCTACVEIAGRLFGAPALRFLLIACGIVSPESNRSRPGADDLTAVGVLDPRDAAVDPRRPAVMSAPVLGAGPLTRDQVPLLAPGESVLRHIDGRTGTFVCVEPDDRVRTQSMKGKGYWIFPIEDCGLVAGPDPATDDDASICGICLVALKVGDSCLNDVDLGPVHSACCGADRESYVGADGEPLADGVPLPTPYLWAAD